MKRILKKIVLNDSEELTLLMIDTADGATEE